ncbi:MAG: hypothetical protein KFF72_20130 [Arthrospira sp. SH-MAG29]|nr:hypothetical protein [Arthrospira sp. SH-MAG29]MBS0018625.1 hypothetical protein [Arthrospira sp. SH-MAG29]
MDIYVKSRGVSKGYSWVNQDNIIVNPPLFTEGIKIVDTDDFSLILYCMQGHLSLLITGLETKDRTDNRTRRIRNSVLWVGNDSNDEEEILRNIAIKALNENEQLEEEVDEAVKSENSDQGFKVDFKIFKNLKLDPLKPAENKPADSRKIGNLSTLKNELIEELLNYRLPEKKEGMLVVVSSTVSQSNLENNVVWRGLSNAIPDDEWIDLPVEGDQGDSFRSDSTTGQSISTGGEFASDSQPSSSRSPITSITSITSNSTMGPPPNRNPQNSAGPIKQWLNLIVAFIFGLVIGIIANQLWYHFTENQLQQTIQSLKGDITELEQEKNSLGKALKIKQQEIQVYEKFESESETRYSHFRDEVEKSYDSFIRDSEKSKQALEAEINALENKANEFKAKSS